MKGREREREREREKTMIYGDEKYKMVLTVIPASFKVWSQSVKIFLGTSLVHTSHKPRSSLLSFSAWETTCRIVLVVSKVFWIRMPEGNLRPISTTVRGVATLEKALDTKGEVLVTVSEDVGSLTGCRPSAVAC